MSHPLTRRLAKATLVLLASAAPVVGAAGGASAADASRAIDLGGITDTTETVNRSAGEATGTATRQLAPVPGHVVGTLAGTTGPAIQETANGTADGAMDLLSATTSATTEGSQSGGLVSDALSTGGLSSTADLPVGSEPGGLLALS